MHSEWPTNAPVLGSGNIATGDGREWEGPLVAGTGGAVRVRLDRPVDHPVESSLELTLFQGRCRPDRFEQVVQQATELGLVAILALDAARADRSAASPRRLEL